MTLIAHRPSQSSKNGSGVAGKDVIALKLNERIKITGCGRTSERMRSSRTRRRLTK